MERPGEPCLILEIISERTKAEVTVKIAMCFDLMEASHLSGQGGLQKSGESALILGIF